MERPTAVLRRLLVLESIQKYVDSEISTVKQQMKNGDLRIIGCQNNQEDIWIQYQCGNEYAEAIFMRKMLDAESRNRAKKPG